MKRSHNIEQSGVQSVASSDEFRPRAPGYKVKIFDLEKFGLPCIPVVGQTVSQSVARASPWHVHKGCIEFIYCTAGACEYESGGEGQRYHLSPGMMFVSRQHEAHRQLECPKGYTTFYMLFKPSANKNIRWFADEFAKLPRFFPCNRSISMRFVRLIALAEREDFSYGMRMRIQMSLWALWFEILDSATLSIKQKIPEVFDEIVKRIQMHPERDYPLDGLVEEAGMSKVSFISLFKAAHGLTPHAYLLHCRIDEAKRLLKDGLSVKVIADRFGFRTTQHFSRTFKNFVGITPRKWLADKRA